MRIPIFTPLDTGGAYPGKATWTLEAWKKNVGDTVHTDEELVEIMTDKAPLTICAEDAGILAEICIDVGEMFECDPSEPGGRVVLGYMEIAHDSESQWQSPSPPISPDISPQAVPPNEPSVSVKVTHLAQNFMRTQGISLADLLLFLGKQPPEKISKEHVLRYLERNARELEEAAPEPPARLSSRLHITPPARLKMRELGISEEDLRQAGVQGSGPGGVIRAEDINAPRAERLGERNEPIDDKVGNDGTPGRTETNGKRRAVPAVQKIIASHIAKGWEKPTAQPSFRCDFSDIVAFRKERAKAFEAATGAKLQLAFPLVASIARVLGRGSCGTCVNCAKKDPCDVVWRFNGYWDDYGEKEADRPGPAFVEFSDANLGIAFNTPADDLVILTAREANNKSLSELARILAGLQRKAQEKTYTLSDVTGYGFIFNNVGGLQALIPAKLREKIVHVSGYSLLSGQVSALLNLGALDEYGQGMVQISFDHRIINGGHAMRFLVAVFEEMLERVLPELRELCDWHA